MFGYNRRKRLKQRKSDYDKLIILFKAKHGIVARYYMDKHLSNNNGLNPVTLEDYAYQRRVKKFFGDKCNDIPHLFNSFAGISYGTPNFDPTPIEKLQKLYDLIEIEFPEPFVQINRDNILKQII